jgi:hypothetical protein
MDWAFSVNVLGFLEKRPLGSTPYETPNFTFWRALKWQKGGSKKVQKGEFLKS